MTEEMARYGDTSNLIAAYDIETMPCQTLPETCVPVFDPSEIKHGNAGPDKRAEKEAEKKAEFEESKNKTMSVTPALAQICTFVGMIYDTEESVIKSKTSVQITDEFDGDDLHAVTDGWDFIRRAYSQRIPLVSFNGIGFDLPIMWHRAIAQDVPVDPVMYNKLTAKFSNNHHYDLLGILAGFTLDKQRGKGLEFWLNLFKLGTKGDMDGSKVYAAWKEKEFNKIQGYCENDVLKTAELFTRVQPWIKIEIDQIK